MPRTYHVVKGIKMAELKVVGPVVKAWCIQELLGITEKVDEVSENILPMSTASELTSYLKKVLDPQNSKHQKILEEFFKLMESCDLNTMSYSQKCSGEFDGKTDPPLKKIEINGRNSPVKEVKKKFVPLYGAEGQARSSVLLPGRHACECLGQKHRLVNNCTECGRIVCMQEGSGPCYFCGALVCTREEQEILDRNSKKSKKLLEKLMTQDIANMNSKEDSVIDKGLQEAIAHKNKLIEYDKSGVRRTKVIDDECDYFASDSRWLSKQEREALRRKEEELREKRYGSRRQQKVTLDFAGRRVIDENVPDYSFDSDMAVLASGYYSADNNQEPQRVSNPIVPNVNSLKFVSSGNRDSKPLSYGGPAMKGKKEMLRIQDKEFQEMTDTGACLSMHQPWASLLVMGIKKAEGRVWYTPHRGRLWIAATAKPPTEQDIAGVEGMYKAYKALYGPESVSFPKHYPTACLLGCVDVVDCLAQEDYKEEFPEGESESPYVFVCENPQQLTVKFPVKGQHKIWKLDPAIHKAAKGGLRKAA